MPLFGAFLAITLSLGDYPTSIAQDGEFSVQANLECSKCSDSYLRGVLFSSESQYFGYTQNNSGDWVSNTSDKTQYYLVPSQSLSTGTWSGQLKFRPDSQAKSYQGPGSYSFKLIRYTPSGSKSTESSVIQLNITGPTLTPTPQPSTPTKSPSNTPQIPSPTDIKKSNPIASPVEPTISDPAPILGAAAIPQSPIPLSPTPPPQISPKTSFSGWVLAVLGGTGVLVSVFLYLFPRSYTKHQ